MFEIKHTASKGFGVFAKRAIPRNTIIMQERAILAVKHASSDPDAMDAAVEAAFKRLSLEDQSRILELHQGSHPRAKTKVTRIVHANSFGQGGFEKVYLNASRINHSCAPNAASAASIDDNNCIRSERDIDVGEEITISYLPPFSEAMTARQRNTVLRLHYAFECRCVACWPSKQSQISDMRRQLIGFLDFALKNQRAPDFTPLNHLNPLAFANWPAQPRPGAKTLTASQKIEYNLLLAKLREAEGLQWTLIAKNYGYASTLLVIEQRRYESWPPTRDIMFLRAVRCSESWFQTAIELDEKWYGPEHESIRETKKVWKKTGGIACFKSRDMMAAVYAVYGEEAMPDPANAFAAQLTPNEERKTQELTQEACTALVLSRIRKV